MMAFSKEWLSLTEKQRNLILAHQLSAPVRIGEIAKALGLAIKSATLPAGVSGEIRPDPTSAQSGFVIKVDRHESKERQRFTVAHEIAHFLLHRDLIKEGLSDDVLYRSRLSNRKEIEANRLAADLIMPWKLIEQWMAQFPESSLDIHIEALANYLQVSKVAMEVRLEK